MTFLIYFTGAAGFVLFLVLLIAIGIKTNELQNNVDQLLKLMEEHIYI